MIRYILENISIMVLTVLVVAAAFYLVLKCLDWGLRRKSGRREQEGLTNLWVSTQTKQSIEPPSAEPPSADGEGSKKPPETSQP